MYVIYILEGLMLKLKFQYFGQLRWRYSLEKTLMLEKLEGRSRRGGQRMWRLDSIINSMDMSLSKLQETVKGREAWCAAIYGVSGNRTWLSDWITVICIYITTNLIIMSILFNITKQSSTVMSKCHVNIPKL